MAIAALVRVYCHRVIGRMTADTERGVEDIAKTGGRVIDMEMGVRRRFIPMTGQTVHHGMVGVVDDHQHRGAGWCGWVDVTGGVVAGGAAAEMGG